MAETATATATATEVETATTEAPSGNSSGEDREALTSDVQPRTHAVDDVKGDGDGCDVGEASWSSAAGPLDATASASSCIGTDGEACERREIAAAAAAGPNGPRRSRLGSGSGRVHSLSLSTGKRSSVSSLDLRKVPEHILLGPDWEGAARGRVASFRGHSTGGAESGIHDDDDSDGKDDKEGRPGATAFCGQYADSGPAKICSVRRLLHRTCLRPTYSLRTQMMLSFGTASALTVCFVMAVSIAASVTAGNYLRTTSQDNLQSWAVAKARSSARYVADAFAPTIPTDVVNIMYEAARDRFSGYPDADGYADDGLVPFRNVDTSRRMYPINAKNLSLDWDFPSKVTDDTYQEHLQHRWSTYRDLPGGVSTDGSFFHMQGTCNPSHKPGGRKYLPNCTDANNDPVTGGVILPVPTTFDIYRRGKDIDPLMKALFESSAAVKNLGFYFANSGAGASINFPQSEVDHTAAYKSVGCDWMRMPNPYLPNETIGTEEEIARCKPKGTVVSNDRYNPMERGWCRDLALQPERVIHGAPFLNAWAEHEWLMSAGRAVYDRITNKFIACALVVISMEYLLQMLEDVKIGLASQITLAKWDENGTVVASLGWDPSVETETTTVDDPKLGLGVDREMFRSLKSIIDYDGEWAPAKIREMYEEKTVTKDDKIVSSYPVPPPPDEYDPNYEPAYMVIVALEKGDMFHPIYELDASLDQNVRNLVTFTLIVGFVGLAIIMCLILTVSVSLTRPLQWMNRVSDVIVKKFGDGFDLSKTIGSEDEDRVFLFSPRTELTELVREFKRLVSRFSGEGSAKAVRFRHRLTEAKNRFVMLDEFEFLYRDRRDAKFKYDYGESSTSGPNVGGTSSDRVDAKMGAISAECAPQRRHFGPNLHFSDGDSKMTAALPPLRERVNVFRSPLFRWVVALMAVPLLATAVIISSVVLWRISNYSKLGDMVQEEFFDLEIRVLIYFARLKAIQTSGVTMRVARDLHVHARVSGWLLFGGLARNEQSYTEVETLAESCKDSLAIGTCNHVVNPPCDCAWNDLLFSTACPSNYSAMESRDLQVLFWEGQRSPWPNGDRNVSASAKSPSETEWYSNVSALPGYEHGAEADGYETTYDRLRVLSATSTIQIPLYNYDVSKSKQTIGIYVGFEADGSILGYSGCNHGHADYSFFVSTQINGAGRIRPDLCPLGSFGYDARCRDWYETGKVIGEWDGAPIYFTPPYKFAGSFEVTAQGCVLPLIDPNTRELVGQALLDFDFELVISSLPRENAGLVNGGFPVLIAVEADQFGNDAVVGPGYTIGDPGRRIEDLVSPYDEKCTSAATDVDDGDDGDDDDDDCASREDGFHAVADAMRAGKAGARWFQRTRADGTVERVLAAFAPVNVTSFRPVNHSDFARGVVEYESVIYSLGLAQPERDMLDQFADVTDDIQKQVIIRIVLLAIALLCVTVLLLCVSSRVTMSITAPILHFLELLRDANRIDARDDFLPPSDFTGSREVLAVYDTFSMLFKVIRVANSAFFSGDIERAYLVLTDALKLFQSLGNKKAVGVASNNLGNCMLAMYRAMKENGRPEMCSLSMDEIISKGTAYFRDAIKLGEEAYDAFYEEQGWSGCCLVFMQHLSSRYFNRAMFFLTVKDDHKYPEEADRLGFRDLDIARNMDVEVADQCVEVGFAIDKAEHLDLLLARICGLLSLMEMGYPDVWGVDDLIEETLHKLRDAIEHRASEYFCEISPAGRMQQLDAELIRYAQLEGRKRDAASIGIRMLVEDEFAFHEAESVALQALCNYAKDAAEGDDGPGITREVRDDLMNFQREFEVKFMEVVLRRMQHFKEESAVRSKNVSMTSASATSSRRNSSSCKQSCLVDITMEFF